MMDWHNFQYFIAVARHGSLSSAAKVLGVNHATMARRIDKLEEELSVRLFDRLTNGYRLTEAGELLFGQLSELEKNISQIENGIKGYDAGLAGVLKVSKPNSGVIDLSSAFSGFMAQYPNIKLEVISSTEFSPVEDLEVDVAIRIAQRVPEGLSSNLLGELEFDLFASEEYLSRSFGDTFMMYLKAPTQTVLTDCLTSLAWVIWKDDASETDMVKQLGDWIDKDTIVYSSNAYDEVHGAILAGVGAGLLPVQRVMKNTKIKNLFDGHFSNKTKVWFVSHEKLVETAKVRVFSEYMQAYFSEIGV